LRKIAGVGKRDIFALRANFTYNINDKIIGTVVANDICKFIFLKNNNKRKNYE